MQKGDKNNVLIVAIVGIVAIVAMGTSTVSLGSGESGDGLGNGNDCSVNSQCASGYCNDFSRCGADCRKTGCIGGKSCSSTGSCY